MGTEHEDGEQQVREESEAQESGAQVRRGRRPRLAVAAVVAAVLVAGGGGAWWAAASGGGHTGDTAAAAPPLRLDGPLPGVPVTGGGPGPSGGGQYRLTGKLPTDHPDRAAVYRAPGGVPQSQVAHLAGLLGVRGQVQSEQGSWKVGGPGGGPTLLVSKSAPGTWTFTRYGASLSGARPDTSTSSSPSSVPVAPGDPGTSSSPGSSGAPPVSQAAAKAAAAPVLKGLGLSGAAVDASQTSGGMRTVSADPVVGGLPTHGWSTSFEVGSDGRISLGYGRLSPLVKGAQYPVVSAAAAFGELKATPVMHPDLCRVEPGGASGCDHQGAPHPVDVRGAVFGLSLEYVSGAQTLVPAWLFDTAPAGTSRTSVLAQTAVDPSYVQPPGGTTTAPPPSSVNPGGPMRVPVPAQPADPYAPHKVAVSGYQASGTTLKVSYMRGTCGTYKTSAVETAGQVRVSVVDTPKPKGTVCSMVLLSQTDTVRLAAPVGDRTVVDTSNGHTLTR
ncbi:hypothetical protein [Actinacidiphila guanduensis]|uniref:Large membrane protein n=1 Tax=Actinacidiphila guanduensis TaxID=310781 RepID=A0A1H0DH10_9ACTN|nr:hypothetical protein [Actinacidiphila guanduensis]SDN69452.1 hypothetical protein SAMN05216259_105218 [Actinacidiphila guanduensis]